MCEQLYSSFKSYCSTHKKTHKDVDCRYETPWPIYIDKNVFKRGARSGKRPAQGAAQSTSNKLHRGSFPPPRPPHSSSSYSSASPPTEALPCVSDLSSPAQVLTWDLPRADPDGPEPGSHASPAAGVNGEPLHSDRHNDDVSPLRSRDRQLSAARAEIEQLRANLVAATVECAHVSGKAEQYEAATSSLLAAQQELAQARTQLCDCDAQLMSTKHQVALLGNASAQKEARIGELLHDQQHEAGAMTSKIEALQRELQCVQRQFSRLEVEHKEVVAEVQHQRSTAAQAIEKSAVSTLQGYILRACDEFVFDCPQYHLQLESRGTSQQVTKERASRLLNCLKDFTELSSRFSEYEQLVVQPGSSEQQAQKVFRKLSLLCTTTSCRL